MYLCNRKSFLNALSFVRLKNWVWKEEKGWLTVSLQLLLLDSQHSCLSHFTHHPEPTYTPAKEGLTLCCILCPKISKHLMKFTTWLFTVYTKSILLTIAIQPPLGWKTVLGRKHVLPWGSKPKVWNIMFLIKLRGNFREKLINYPLRMLSG